MARATDRGRWTSVRHRLVCTTFSAATIDLAKLEIQYLLFIRVQMFDSMEIDAKVLHEKVKVKVF